MRIIDIAVPSSNESEGVAHPQRPALQGGRSTAFRAKPTLEEYTLQDEEASVADASHEHDEDEKDADEFFEAPDSSEQVSSCGKEL